MKDVDWFGAAAEGSGAISRCAVAATVVGLCMLAAVPAAAQFTPDDRIVSDPSVNLPNPEFDQHSNVMVWQENSGNIWLAKINPMTGDIFPTTGKGKLIDDIASSASDVGNTPQWSYGDGIPYVVYTRNRSAPFALAEAVQGADQSWARREVANAQGRWRPEGTNAEWAGPARIAYNWLNAGQPSIAWRTVGDAASERSIPGGLGQGARWIAGENALVTMISVGGVNQLATIDVTQANPSPVQITFEPEGVINPFSWHAPEFGAPAFVAMIGNQKLGIFRKTGPNAWQKTYTITFPSAFSFVSSPEAFVWNGKSYVFAVAASLLGSGSFQYQPAGPSQIWIAGIDPGETFFRRIDDPAQARIKAEPEVFFTATGPKIYYNERDPNSGNWLLRLASTGLGAHWGYDRAPYSGPWAALYRDNKNCSCTPFPIGDSYVEEPLPPTLANRQWVRSILGPEGNLYVPLVHAQTTRTGSVVAYNTQNRQEVFRVEESAVGSGIAGSNGLVASNGDVFVAGATSIRRYRSFGTQVWSAPVRGLTTTPQFGPDGSVILFTFNGWFQSFHPATGQLLNERNLTPGHTYPETPECLTFRRNRDCPAIAAPAVDPISSRVYVSYSGGDGSGTVRAFVYDQQSHDVTLLWTTSAPVGNLSAPVLSADYSRLYVQSQDGNLHAIDTANGSVIWSAVLGFKSAGTPVVNAYGYIVPSVIKTNDSSAGFVGILKDNGNSATWAFKTNGYAPESHAAAGVGNRFAIVARRSSDNAFVLLVFHPKFGIVAQTQLTRSPLPVRFTGLVLNERGWVFVGTTGQVPYRAFRPSFETTVRAKATVMKAPAPKRASR